jgi:hypothetical protein
MIIKNLKRHLREQQAMLLDTITNIKAQVAAGAETKAAGNANVARCRAQLSQVELLLDSEILEIGE